MGHTESIFFFQVEVLHWLKRLKDLDCLLWWSKFYKNWTWRVYQLSFFVLWCVSLPSPSRTLPQMLPRQMSWFQSLPKLPWPCASTPCTSPFPPALSAATLSRFPWPRHPTRLCSATAPCRRWTWWRPASWWTSSASSRCVSQLTHMRCPCLD